MNSLVLKIVRTWKSPSKKHHILFSFIIISLLVLTWLIVYFYGGKTNAYVHFMYLPIIFSSFFWGPIVGVLTAIIGGIIIGPCMPLNVEHPINNTFLSMLLRTTFFIVIALFVGYISSLLKTYIHFAHHTYEQLSMTYANTLRNYARMVSVRDKHIADHCERVAYNSRLVGIEYGLNEHQSEALYWAGLLHDVGKLGVAEDILLKPEKLTLDEYAEIKQHTILGYEIINSLSTDLKEVSEGIRSHHEKWNGEGYPDGLRGKEIPLFGRIISIVDVFEALTSTRPYKNSWSKQEAIEYIKKEKGKSFDPELVDIFEKLYKKGKLWISNEPVNLNKKLIPITFHIQNKRFIY